MVCLVARLVCPKARRSTQTTQVFPTALVISQKVETMQCLPADEWIHKMWYIQTKEYYLATKRHEVPTHDDSGNMMLSERSQ